jgi:hypothetical protein
MLRSLGRSGAQLGLRGAALAETGRTQGSGWRRVLEGQERGVGALTGLAPARGGGTDDDEGGSRRMHTGAAAGRRCEAGEHARLACPLIPQPRWPAPLSAGTPSQGHPDDAASATGRAQRHD